MTIAIGHRVMLRLFAVAVVSALWVLDARAALHHDLDVALDPTHRRLVVTDRIRVDAGRELALRLSARFQVQHALLDGRAVAPERDSADGHSAWVLKARAPEKRPAVLEVRYAAELDALETLDHRQVLGLSRPLGGSDGAYIAANTGWYPSIPGELVTYRLRVIVPAGFRAVASGDIAAESMSASGAEAIFEVRNPLPGIDLLAGPYRVSERLVRLSSERQVRVRTYFHAELEALSDGYLESVAAYLRRYDAWIGAYAFDAYSVVSSPLPTGFGMPGIAYLGKQVLRLPFIRSTSLGHEVLHDWWGNGVYPDYAKGNWSEGMTTFLADYAFKEDEGEAAARAMRLAWLRDFAAVRPEQDRPLSQFTGRRHGADQAIGYNKTAFVLFMLRDLIGAQHFHAGLRRFWNEHRFRVASWDDLRAAFEASANRDLRSFFTQWLSRRGAPSVEIVSARRSSSGGLPALTVELRQSSPPYRLNVPLRVQLANGASLDKVATLTEVHARLTVELPQSAHAVLLDPDIRIFRRLEPEEVAPILREVILDRRATLAVPGKDSLVRKAANELAGAMLEHVPSPWQGTSLVNAPPVLIVGVYGEVANFLAHHGLPGLPDDLKDRGTGLAYARRAPGGNAYVVVAARDVDALRALARALPHLGAQSFVGFDGARSIERGVWATQARPVVVTD